MEEGLRLSVGVAGQKESNIDLEEGSLDQEQGEETAARPLPRSLRSSPFHKGNRDNQR